MSLVLILRVFRIRRVYRVSIFFSLVLILRMPGYLAIKGDQLFSDLGFFSTLVLCTNWCTAICITCPVLRKFVQFLRKFVQFLRKIECIKFVSNKFVLVLVQIDLIQFENSIVLDQFVLKLIQICYIQIWYIQFCVKSDTWYKLQYTNLYVKRAPKKIPKSVTNWSPFLLRHAGICRISTKEKKINPL